MTKPLLEISGLSTIFSTDDGIIEAVSDVSFSISRGQTLGLVGESGCGKSVTGFSILQLVPSPGVIEDGKILYYRDGADEPIDIATLPQRGEIMRSIRGNEIAMIFQESISSFSPVHTIGNQIMEAILYHRNVSKQEAREIAIDMLKQVGISSPAQRFQQYAFELSGGMRQRAMIAVALSSDPSLLIADEPTTSLDVTIQAQILDLMTSLQEEHRMAIIFITHDLGVIAQIADEIKVMYLGRIMEGGTTRDVINSPKHPYTRKLLKAIPRIDHLGGRLISVGGDIPGPFEIPGGCPFHTRCQQMIVGLCNKKAPAITSITETHSVNCFLYE